MFIDEVTFSIEAGNGGNGAVTFRTEKHVPRGGPDGGDGGKGGSVVFETDPNLSGLLDFRPGKRYKAERGGNGAAKHQYGKDGADLVLKVPPGTQVIDHATGEILADLTVHPSREIVARGGRGGRGNMHFTSSVQQAPKFAELGEPGEDFQIRLELKVLADVGLLGFPNVGKSTLLSVVSAARPKIADYPFTTLVPNLGVVRIDDAHNYVIADIPGVIEGASDGAGLGIQFLKHLERTRLLLHMIDVSGLSGRDPLTDLDAINRELAAFSERLAALPQLVVLSRIDVADPDSVETVRAHYADRGFDVRAVSAATGVGVRELVFEVHRRLLELPKDAAIAGGAVRITANERADEDPRHFTIERAEDGALVVRGRALERTVAMTDMNNDIAVRRLQRQFARWGVFAKLKTAGAAEGDTVRIRHLEFDYIDDDAPDRSDDEG